MIKVKIIKRNKQSTLVEWGADECLHRVYIPTEAIDEDCQVSSEDLAMGIVYGIDWENVLTEKVITPTDMACALRRVGIWTKANLESNPQVMIGAILGLAQLDLASIYRAAKRV